MEIDGKAIGIISTFLFRKFGESLSKYLGACPGSDEVLPTSTSSLVLGDRVIEEQDRLLAFEKVKVVEGLEIFDKVKARAGQPELHPSTWVVAAQMKSLQASERVMILVFGPYLWNFHFQGPFGQISLATFGAFSRNMSFIGLL